MRIDVVTIFPEVMAALDVSLVGKARANDLLDIRVHDLRDFTHDRHRTVDDTPYGGGAGMVMRPEPWGEALDRLVADGPVPTLIVPSAAGKPFTHADAVRLASLERIAFACGRYEGIDQRVIDHAATRMPVEEVCLGDFVLNGGEVAALAVIEAVVRLLPGFMGNPESLAEESHADGLLEYPVYTKPASWRGYDVPEVLLSGHHGRIEDWRREQSRQRTYERRPDLLHGSALIDGVTAEIVAATPADAPELLVLQRCCWLAEAEANPGVHIAPLTETLDEVIASIGEWTTFRIRHDGRLVASVRGRLSGEAWDIGRLMVAPDLEGRGLGRRLLEYIESVAPSEATTYEMFTGAGSSDNLRMYRKAGYRVHAADTPGTVRLTKPRH